MDVRIDMSTRLVVEELLDVLDELDTGEQNTLVTADGETSLPEGGDEEGSMDAESSGSDGEDLEDGDSEAEDLEDAPATEEDEPDPSSVEVAPTEEG